MQMLCCATLVLACCVSLVRLNSAAMSFLTHPFSRTYQRAGAWLALLAMLLAVLVPSLSHAAMGNARFGNADLWAQICRGNTSLATFKNLKNENAVNTNGASNFSSASNSALNPAAPSPALPGKMFAAEHCPFCALHAGQDLPPPPSAFVFQTSAPSRFFPALYYAAPTPLFNWTAHQPRGPPAWVYAAV